MIIKKDNNGLMEDVRIFSKENQKIQTSIYSSSGELEMLDDAIVLMLYDGEIHELDLNDYRSYRRINFKRHKIIVPADEGINNSGPFSPTIDGLPTGGLPPLAKPGKASNGPPKIAPKAVLIPSLKSCLAISFKIPAAASPKDFACKIASTKASETPVAILSPIFLNISACLFAASLIFSISVFCFFNSVILYFFFY